MRTQCTDRVHAIVVLQMKAGLVLGSNLVYSWFYSGWLGSGVVSVLDSGAEGPGSNRSRDSVG